MLANTATYLLHLSDMHIVNSRQAEMWANQLITDVRKELDIDTVHGIVVSGDVGNKSSPDEYRAAKVFFDQVMEELHIAPASVLLVPGNHDMDWTASQEAYGAAAAAAGHDSTGLITIDDNDPVYRDRFRHYAAFHRELTGLDYPDTYEDQFTLVHLAERGVLLLGLNSSWHIDHQHTTRAAIHTSAIARTFKRVRNHRPYDDCPIKIAVWHHPLHSNDPDRITEHGFVEHLIVNGFSVGLHGHMHKADNHQFHFDRGSESDSSRRIHVVAAGTFGAPVRAWEPGIPLQYNVLQIEGNALTVHTRRREVLEGAWRPDARWTTGPGGPSQSRYRIRLGPRGAADE